VNIRALDLSEAFDKTNHHGLFIKLMDRNILVNLLLLIGNFLLKLLAWTWVCYIMSKFVGVTCGVLQGGVISSSFFAISLHTVVKKVSDNKMVAMLMEYV